MYCIVSLSTKSLGLENTNQVLLITEQIIKTQKPHSLYIPTVKGSKLRFYPGSLIASSQAR